MMKFKLKALSIYEKGNYREGQEDYIFPIHNTAAPTDLLYMVCDGMGGHEAGEVASRAVCEAMSQSILNVASQPSAVFTADMLKLALAAAYDQLDARDPHPESDKKMGTTMTLLKFHADGVIMAHIGDSRIYQFRPDAEGKLQIVFRTEDHSLVNDLLRVGEITPEEAKTFARKNVITRAMQAQMERRPNADIHTTTDVRAGDYFFMCSDGMLENATDENLEYMIGRSDLSDEDKVKMLLGNSEDNHDNHSAYLVHVLEVENDGKDEPLVLMADGPKGPTASVPTAQPKPAPAPRQQTASSVGTTTNVPAKSSKQNYLIIAMLVIAAAAVCAWFFSNRESDDADVKQAVPDTEQAAPEELPMENSTVPQTPTERKQHPSEGPVEAVPVGGEAAHTPAATPQPAKVNDNKAGEKDHEAGRQPEDKPQDAGADKDVKPTAQGEASKPAQAAADVQSDETPVQSNESSLGKITDKIKAGQEGNQPE